MSDKKIVVAGHLCVDITPEFLLKTPAKDVKEVLRPGTLLQVGPVTNSVGGVVANTGLALKKFGTLEPDLWPLIDQDVFSMHISWQKSLEHTALVPAPQPLRPELCECALHLPEPGLEWPMHVGPDGRVDLGRESGGSRRTGARALGSGVWTPPWPVGSQAMGLCPYTPLQGWIHH